MEEKPMNPPSAARFVPSKALQFVEAFEQQCVQIGAAREADQAVAAATRTLDIAVRALPEDEQPLHFGGYARGFRAGEQYRAWYQQQFESIESEHKVLRVFAQSVAESLRLDSPLMVTARASNDEETSADIVLRVLRERLDAPTPTPGVVLSALAVPETWSAQESAVMVGAYERTRPAHGVTETCFAVAAALLRHRQQLVARNMVQADVPSDPKAEQILGARGRVLRELTLDEERELSNMCMDVSIVQVRRMIARADAMRGLTPSATEASR